MYYRIFSKIYEIGARQMCEDCKDFITPGSKILDLGCGSGIAAKHFQNFFKSEIVGVDIKDNRTVSIPFEIFDGENLPFKENSFNTTLLGFVLHHSQNPEKLLREAKRISKKIIIFEDLPEGILSKIRCFFHQITFFGDTRRNFSFKKREDWREIFATLNLKILAERKVFTKFKWFDPVKKILFVLEK